MQPAPKIDALQLHDLFMYFGHRNAFSRFNRFKYNVKILSQ